MKATKRPYPILLLLIILTGFAIRLFYVLQLEDKLWWVDEVDYLALGESIASGDGFVKATGEPTAFRPPGYPLLLAGMIKLGINAVPEIRLAHVFISIGTLFILFLLSLKIAGPVAALVSTTVAAGYPYFIFGVGALYPLTAFSGALVVSVYLILMGHAANRWLVALSGFFMGLAILMRTSAAILAVMAVIWLFVMLHRMPKKFLVTAFVYGLAVTGVVAPWLIRNIVVFGKPVLSTNGGRNLWLGNNPHSTINSGSDIPMPNDLEQRIDAANEIEANAIFSAEAKKFIKSNSWHIVKISVQKGLALWRVDPSPTTSGYPHYKNFYALMSILGVAPVFLLAVLGFFMADRERKKIMLLFLLFALAFTLLHAVYITKVRFRLPLDYFLIVMAGSAVAALLQRSTLIHRLFTRFPAGFYHDDSPTRSLSFISRQR